MAGWEFFAAAAVGDRSGGGGGGDIGEEVRGSDGGTKALRHEGTKGVRSLHGEDGNIGGEDTACHFM